MRGNTFDVGASMAIQIWSDATPDLGTADDLGVNTFADGSSTAISMEGTATISAIGNYWSGGTPACGDDIVVTSAGTVVWGTGEGEQCP